MEKRGVISETREEKCLLKSKYLDITRSEKARIDSNIRIEKDLEIKVGR